MSEGASPQNKEDKKMNQTDRQVVVRRLFTVCDAIIELERTGDNPRHARLSEERDLLLALLRR